MSLPNTTVAALFVAIFGQKMQFLEPINKNEKSFVQGGILFINIYLCSPFLIKLHPCFLVLLIYFAFNSNMSGFFFKKKMEFTLSVCSVCSLNESPDFGTSRRNNTVEKQPESSQEGFYCIFPFYQKLIGKAIYFPCGKLYYRMGI